MGDQQSAAADAGWTAAEMGTCTIAAIGQKDRSPRSSNMFTRLKKEPRVRKASKVRGSPYTNPLRAKKGRTRLYKSTLSSCTDAAAGTTTNPEGKVRHEDEVVTVLPIAVTIAGRDVVVGTVPDAALKVICLTYK